MSAHHCHRSDLCVCVHACICVCVCVIVRASCGCVRYCSLSLEELLCHRAPCITEHQPYTTLASRGYVGQFGNDAADEHTGEVSQWKTGRRPLR